MEQTKAQWCQDILAGLKSVPVKQWGTPGIMAVDGEYAEPILASDGDVLLAAAEMGLGRIFVCCHDNFTKVLLDGSPPGNPNLERLYDNVQWWVSTGNYKKLSWKTLPLNESNLQHALKDEETILVWSNPQPQDLELVDDLKKFVNGGGGVIIGVTPWGEKQIFKNDIAAISCYWFLREVGIYLLDGTLKSGHPVPVNPEE